MFTIRVLDKQSNQKTLALSNSRLFLRDKAALRKET